MRILDRTTTESSAKNRSVAVLTTTIPSTETIMASTTLTLPLAEASPAAAQSFGIAHGTILALDLGTMTGWALQSAAARITSGTVSFRPSRYDGGGVRYLRFRAWLDGVATDAGGIGVVHYEEVRRTSGTDAAHVYGGLLATLTAWCEQRGDRLPGRARRHHQAVHRRQG